jgi:tRNA (guanine-N7-)-methyltransferase
MGETTARMAASRPDVNFLGIEVYMPGVGALAKHAHDTGLTNLRIIRHDAVDVIRTMLPPQSLEGIHIYFPDPWPKSRHHKRRLVAPAFVAQLAERLTAHGYLHCATDWAHYAEQMMDVLSHEPALVNAHPGFAPSSDNPLCHRPDTKFHTRGERLGHGIWDLVFLKKP